MRKPESNRPRLRSGRLPAPERREAILAAAVPLFARRGWLGTGTRELAAAAGVTEPVLYRHFPDKQALFLAVLERAAGGLAGVVARHAARAERAPEQVRALAQALGEMLDGRLDDLRLLCGAAGLLEEEALAAAARRHLSDLVGALARRLSAPGLARGVDPQVGGALLLEVGLGAALLWPLGVPVTLEPGFRDRAVSLLVRALTG